MKQPKQIENDFIVLNPRKEASIEHADQTLYDRLDTLYDGFKGHELISSYEFEADWPSWEVHPHGDEVVLLISGAVEFLLKTAEGETATTLEKQGQYVIVPKGIWHTAKIKRKSKLLFITPGQDTQHRDC